MGKNIDSKKIKEALSRFSEKKVLIVGDIMLDHYIYGEVSRVSPEAPVPILKKTHEEFVPGGAANVANNLVSLGAKVSIAGAVGNDYAFKILKDILRKGKINIDSVLISKEKQTIQKERLVAKNQHMFRLDSENSSNLSLSEEKKLLDLIAKQINECDGVILSDYAKGVFSNDLAQSIIKLAKKLNKPIFADIKPINKPYFKGVDVITPNLKEALEIVGVNDIYQAGQSLVDYYKTDVVVTKGDQGISIFKINGEYVDIPTKKIIVEDVTGAGDTYIAVQALGILSGLNLEDAGYIATIAATIVVQEMGTSVITIEELESAIEEDNHVETLDIIPKIWGFEKWLENNDKYCCKLLSLNKGFQCSLHYHKNKDETFFVTKGHIRLELENKVIHMRPGNFMRITPGSKHRFSGIEDSMIIEISTHHEDSDSYRIEKSKKI